MTEQNKNYDQKKLEEILEFDFSSNEEFNIDEYYQQLIKINDGKDIDVRNIEQTSESDTNQTQSESNNQEEVDNENENNEEPKNTRIKSDEEKRIEELAPVYLDKEFYDKLEKLKNNLFSYFARYDVNSEYIKYLTDNREKEGDEYDKKISRIFAIGQFMFKSFEETIQQMVFVFNFEPKDYHLINTILTKDVEITANETILEGINEFLSYYKKWGDIYKNNRNQKAEYPMSIGSIVLLYHFLQKKSIKGLGTEKFYNLQELMFQLKDCNDLYNNYATIKQRIGDNFQSWTNSIDFSDEAKPNKGKEQKQEGKENEEENKGKDKE